MCGIAGVAGLPEAATITRNMLVSLQGRGQAGAGVAASTGHEIACQKKPGLVHEALPESVIKNLKGSVAIGQVRYPTSGNRQPVTEAGTQPIVTESHWGTTAIVHNGQITNAPVLREIALREGAIFQSDMDSEVISHLIAQADARSFAEAIVKAVGQLRGSYSLLIINNGYLYAIRDPRGIRPLFYGISRDGAIQFASETAALVGEGIGLKEITEIETGEMMTVDPEGFVDHQTILSPLPKTGCSLEIVYLADPTSYFNDRSVARHRQALGKALFNEQPLSLESGITVPILDSGLYAAEGWARASGIQLETALHRRRWHPRRSFIEGENSLRDRIVELKFVPIVDLITGEDVVMVDDSLIRGRTTRKLIRMLRQAGARSVHVRISSPPVRRPCHLGIDFPTYEELIAPNKTVDEIRQAIGADSLGYLSADGMAKALELEGKLCRHCFTGEDPLLQIEPALVAVG